MNRIIFILVAILMLASCSSQKRRVIKNFKKTDVLADKLFQSNGNAFAITSTYSTYSQVWTYTKEYRIGFNLVNSKIVKSDTTVSEFYYNYLKEAQKTFKGVSPTNCIELDGDIFLIMMEYNGNDDIVPYYSVNIKCLFDENNTFIKALAKDAIDFLNPIWLKE